MHRFVAHLLVVSLGGVELAGCADSVPLPPPKAGPQSFDVLGETVPEVVTEAYVASDLKTGPVPVSQADCAAACGPQSTGCEAYVVVSGEANRPTHLTGHLQCHFPDTGGGGGWDPFHLNSCPFGCGRRPRGVLAARRERSSDPLQDHVADMAIMEALSVTAFAQLGRDVACHAPSFLPRIARAMHDERRHTRQARRVLRELGGRARQVPRVRPLPRSLGEAAFDNAVEGCVHETFGAIVAMMQAGRAEHPSIRRFFSLIAEDEVDHAALSWDLHDALAPRLGPETHAALAHARMRALERIERMPALPEPVRRAVGAPTHEERSALVRMMRSALSSSAVA